MRIWLAAALILTVLAAGCTQPDPADGDPAPTLTTAANGRPPVWGGPSSSNELVNMTGCSGALAAILVPVDQTQVLVPSPFVVQNTVPGFALFRLDVYTCEKVAVSGVDQGPGGFAYAAVKIEEGQAGMPSDDFPSWWLFEAWTSVDQIRALVSPMGVPAQDAELSQSFSATPAVIGRLTAEVADQNGSVYTMEGAPYFTTSMAERRFRLFYGSSANEWFTLTGVTLESTGDGPGELTFNEASTLSRIFDQGNVATGTFGQSRDGTRVLRGP